MKAFSPTFHVYHNFRLKNFYILEKQPIIVEFLADFVSRGSVVKTEQKPTVGRSFDNNSRERGKSGSTRHIRHSFDYSIILIIRLFPTRQFANSTIEDSTLELQLETPTLLHSLIPHSPISLRAACHPNG